MRVLIVKEKWGKLILSKEKNIEIRGSKTNVRERVGIAFSGTGKIYGEVDIVGCLKYNSVTFEMSKGKHLVDKRFKELPYKEVYGWLLRNAEWYKEPKEYKHPKGAVIWVNIKEGDTIE